MWWAVFRLSSIWSEPHLANGICALDLSCLCTAGGEGAPDLTDSLKNLVINAVAVVGLSLLLARDLQSSSKDNRVLEREEALSRLQVLLGLQT